MPRIQVYVPDPLHEELKKWGLSPSELLQGAIRTEIERLEKIAELDRYLSAIEARVRPPSAKDKAWAAAIARRIRRRTAKPARRAS